MSLISSSKEVKRIGMTLAFGIIITCSCIDLCVARAHNSGGDSYSNVKTSVNISEESVSGNKSCEVDYCEDRCNGTCYNSKVNICVDNRLDCSCLVRCNDTCYNPYVWDCRENKLCPKGQILSPPQPLDDMGFKGPGSSEEESGIILVSHCSLPRDSAMRVCPETDEGTSLCEITASDKSKCHKSGGLYCGDVCYRRNQDIAIACSADGRALCGNGLSYCNYECYSPESGAKCYEGHTLCQAGEEYCGHKYSRTPGSCYDPMSGAICYQNEILCQKNESICDRECYDVTGDAICLNTTYKNQTFISLCHKNESLCGFYCYDPQPEGVSICYGKVLCRKGEAKCGSSCFDPNTEKCIKDRFACRKGMKQCGDFCMWPRNETCNKMYDNETVSPTPCPNSGKFCYDRCYNPDYSTCSNRKLCPVGLKSLGGKKCVKGILCNQGEEVCNGKCYNPLKIGKHVSCTKKFDTRGWYVWYENNERKEMGQITQSRIEEFKCDTGYEENMNGECELIVNWNESKLVSPVEKVHGKKDHP